jgi:hypothetical protein
MAPLPVYVNKQNVNPGPPESTAYSIERYGRIQEESIDKGGEAVAKLGQAYEKHVMRSEVIDWQAKSSAYEVDQEAEYQRQKSLHGNDTSWVPDFLAKRQQGLEALTSHLSTPEAQDYATTRTAALSQEFGRRAYAEAAHAELEGNKASVEQVATNYANLAAGDFTNAKTYALNGMHAVAAANLGAEMAPTAVRIANHVFDSATEGFLGKLEGNPFITSEQVDKAKSFYSDPKNGFVGDAENPGASASKYAEATKRLNDLTNYAQGTPERLARYNETIAAQAVREAKATNNARGGEIFSKSITVDADGNTHVDPQGMANALALAGPGGDREIGMSVFDALDRINRQVGRPVQADGSTLQQLENAVVNKQIDDVGLYKMVGTAISVGQYNFLKTHLDNTKTEQGRLANDRMSEIVQSAKTQLGISNNGGAGVTPDQQRKFDQWHSWFMGEISRRLKNGENQMQLLGIGEGPTTGVMGGGMDWQGQIDRIKGSGTPGAAASGYARYQGVIQQNTAGQTAAPAAQRVPIDQFMRGQ